MNSRRFKKMNGIFYNPPLPPLLVRGLVVFIFLNLFIYQIIIVCNEKNQQINSNVPLPGGVKGWVNLSIYLFADFSLIYKNTE